MTSSVPTGSNNRVWIWLGAALLFCLCAVGAAVFLFYQIGRQVQEGIDADPESAARAAREIVDYDLPPGYREQFAMNFIVYSFVMIAPDPAEASSSDPVIMLAQFQSTANQQEMEEQIRRSFEQQAGGGGSEMKLIEVREMVIRGEQVPVAIYEGRSENGYVMRQLLATFPGKDGTAMLMVMGTAQGWDQGMIDEFIESIR